MRSCYKVTIGVPIYGVEKYIERCARSLFEQTYENIEYIFVNDNTPDKSINILFDVMKDYPKRKNQIKLCNNKCNLGLAGVRNIIIREASGIFMLFVDSDDWLAINAIEELVKKQSQNNSDIISFDSIWHYKTSKKYHSFPLYKDTNDMLEKCLSGNMGNSIWGRFFRTSLIQNNNISCKEGLNLGEDFQLLIPLIYYCKNVSNLNKYLYNYECRNIHSYTHKYTEEKLREIHNSYEITYQRFPEHSQLFEDAFNKRLINSYCAHLIITCKDKISPFYYKKILNKARNLPRKYRYHLPLLKRIILYIEDYSFACFYIRLMLFFKKIKTKITGINNNQNEIHKWS